jgi:hypothetical protein
MHSLLCPRTHHNTFREKIFSTFRHRYNHGAIGWQTIRYFISFCADPSQIKFMEIGEAFLFSFIHPVLPTVSAANPERTVIPVSRPCSSSCRSKISPTPFTAGAFQRNIWSVRSLSSFLLIQKRHDPQNSACQPLACLGNPTLFDLYLYYYLKRQKRPMFKPDSLSILLRQTMAS